VKLLVVCVALEMGRNVRNPPSVVILKLWHRWASPETLNWVLMVWFAGIVSWHVGRVLLLQFDG